MLRVHFCYMKNKVLDIILFALSYCTDLSLKKQLTITSTSTCILQFVVHNVNGSLFMV